MTQCSASQMIANIETLLTSASEFGTALVSRNDYGILARAPGACAIVIRYRRTDTTPLAFSAPAKKALTIHVDVEGFVKETGDSKAALDRQVQLADALWNVFHWDQSLGGAVKISTVESIDTQGGFVVEIAGFRWMPVVARVIGQMF